MFEGYICLLTKNVSIKQSENPESTSVRKDEISYNIKETEGIRDL